MAEYDYLSVSNGSGDSPLITVQTDRLAGVATIDVDTVANVPTKFIGTWGTLGANGLITPSTKRDFRGRVVGADIVIEAMEPGSVDTGNVTSQIIVIKPNTGWSNRVATFIKNITGLGTPEPVTVSNATVGGTLGVAGATTLTGPVAGVGYSLATISNPYKFSVYWASGQGSYMVNPGQAYIMKYDTKLFDTGNNFNISTWKFTAPVAGFYQFVYMNTVNNGITNNGWFNTALLKNGAIIIQTQNPTQTQQPNTSIGASKLIQLNAGDLVHVTGASAVAGIGISDGGASYNYFSGFLVSAT